MSEPRESTAKWAVRKPDGTVLRFPNLDVLQSWIRDGIVVKGDWIEHEEAGWTRVEAVTELAVMMAKSTTATKPPAGPRLATEPEDDQDTAEALTGEEDGPPPLPFPSAVSAAPETPTARTRKMTRARPPATAGEQSVTSNVISLSDVERPSLSREEIESEGENVLGAVVPPALPSDAGAEVMLPLTPGSRPRGSSPRTGPLSARPSNARREPSRADIELQRALIRRGRAAKLRRRALLGVAFVGGLAGLTVWALSQRGETIEDRAGESRTVESQTGESQTGEGTHETGAEAAGGLGAGHAEVAEAATSAGSEPAASAPQAPDRLETPPVAAATGDPAREEALEAAGAGQYVSPEDLGKAKAEAAARASEQARALAEAQAEAASLGAQAKVDAAEQARVTAAEQARVTAADAAAAKQAADAAAAKQAADAAAAKQSATVKQAAEAAAAKQAAEAAAAKRAAEAAAAKQAEAAREAADSAATKKAADAAAAKKAADAAAAKKAAESPATKKSVVPTAPAKTESEPAPRDVASLMVAARKLEKGKPVEALRLYREALTMSPSNTDVLMAMGRTQIALANVAGAEAYLRKCRSISASHSGCLYWLGRTLAMTGKTSESNQLFHEYLSRNPDGSLADDVRKRLGQ